MERLNPSSALEESGARYRPVDLGRTVGLSASQIRNYEAAGFLPPSQRTSTGYRRYGDEHLVALLVARHVIRGYGWQPALEVMKAAHRGDAEGALALTDRRHAQLDDQRRQVAEALEALNRTRRQVKAFSGTRLYGDRVVTIGQAARMIGVKPSAIRYWESRGVIGAHRASNGRRSYDQHLLRQLQLIKLLRDINYPFDTIGAVVGDLSHPTSTKAREALEERSRRIERASRQAARATAALIDYLDDLDGPAGG